MLQRAYSTFEVKAVDEDQRIIEGIATTPSPDRMADVVEPLGAEYALPIPFLWQHESREAPIGHVFSATPTKDGIPVRIRIESDDEPGPLKDRLDYAWRSIKKGLVRGLSIGFQGLDSEPIKGTHGIRFKRWSWLELSAVTIPANQEASIQTVKSIDSAWRAASGKSATVSVPQKSPGVSGTVSITHTAPRGGDMKITDRIKDFEATRQAKQARITAIVEATSSEGRSKDAAEKEEFDELMQDIDTIDAELKDLRRAEKMMAAAKAVDPEPTQRAATETRTVSTVTAKPRSESEKGIRFAQLVKCVGIAHLKRRDVESVAMQLYPDDPGIQKAAVAAGSTVSGGSNWGSQLVGDETGVFADFAEFLRPMTILGRFGSDGIPSLRNIPFRTPLISQTGGGQGYWVGEGKAKPLTKMAFARTTLEPLKVANIAALTKEVITGSSPQAVTIVRDDLAAALTERQDIDFIDPDNAGSATTPASITDSITPIPSTGTDATGIRADVRAVMEGFITANNPPSTGVWIMSSTTALALSLIWNELETSQVFPGITMAGGTFMGLPVIVSEHVPADSAGGLVVLVNASDIYQADEGGVSIDVSTEASLEMQDDDTTAGDSIGSTNATSLVSLWQTNTVGFLAERTINWKRRRESGVQVLTGVNWGVEGS